MWSCPLCAFTFMLQMAVSRDDRETCGAHKLNIVPVVLIVAAHTDKHVLKQESHHFCLYMYGSSPKVYYCMLTSKIIVVSMRFYFPLK